MELAHSIEVEQVHLRASELSTERDGLTALLGVKDKEIAVKGQELEVKILEVTTKQQKLSVKDAVLSKKDSTIEFLHSQLSKFQDYLLSKGEVSRHIVGVSVSELQTGEKLLCNMCVYNIGYVYACSYIYPALLIACTLDQLHFPRLPTGC